MANEGTNIFAVPVPVFLPAEAPLAAVVAAMVAFHLATYLLVALPAPSDSQIFGSGHDQTQNDLSTYFTTVDFKT